MEFKQEKKIFLSKPDKSAKGNIDKDILKLIKLINSKKDYYTTSSCSGRITLLKETGKKEKGLVLRQWHSAVNFSELKNSLKNLKEKEVWLVIEPPILAVACVDLKAAKQIVDAARHAGWKKSGILLGKKIIAELACPERMEMPIVSKGKIIFGNEIFRTIIDKADFKLQQSRNKINKLFFLIKKDKELEKKIIIEAKNNIGKRYKYGASVEDAPNLFDCSSFVCYIFGKHGINLPRCSIEQIECGGPIEIEKLSPCDIVFLKGNKPHFNSLHKNGVGHVGIYAGKGKVIHASSKAGKVISQDLKEFKKKGWRGARRLL